jgi:hypothetical protein
LAAGGRDPLQPARVLAFDRELDAPLPLGARTGRHEAGPIGGFGVGIAR